MQASRLRRWLVPVGLGAVVAVLGSSATPLWPQTARAATSQTQPNTQKTMDFEKDEVGKTPAGFTTTLTGDGGPVTWVIQEDPTAPNGRKVLAQTSADQTDDRFPLCIYDGFTGKDVNVSVKFKAIAGAVDRAGGLVARFKDKDNYYVVRANALEDNVRLYKVEGGQRKQFAGVNAKVTSGRWHTLGLSLRGHHFVVSFEGKPLFEADDSTFGGAGNVGLWTKADSVTRFDDLTIAGFDAP